MTQQQAEGAWRQETASVHVSQDYGENNQFPAPNPKAERLPLWSGPRGARAASHVATSLLQPSLPVLLRTRLHQSQGPPLPPTALVKSLVTGRGWVPGRAGETERDVGVEGLILGRGHARCVMIPASCLY